MSNLEEKKKVKIKDLPLDTFIEEDRGKECLKEKKNTDSENDEIEI